MTSKVSPTSEFAPKDVAPFLKQLRAMLNEEQPTIIRWTNNGRAFEIVDMELMMEHVLPKYFKHRKYTSFQRQLNYFNFRKWTKSKATMCTFSNEFFVRDQPELAWRITRKKSVHSHHQQKAAGKSSRAAISSPPPFSGDEEDDESTKVESVAHWSEPTTTPFAISVPTISTCNEALTTAPFPSPTDMDMMLKSYDYTVYDIEPTSLSAPAAQLEPFEWIDALLPFVDRPEEEVYPTYVYPSVAMPVSRPYDYIAL